MCENQKALYRSWRRHIWTGDLLEWDSETILGSGIQWFTGKDVNHTSQVIRYTNFDKERVYNLEALQPGVYPNLLSHRLENFRGRVYWLQLNPEFDQYRPAIAREGMKYVGRKYDYRSLFQQAFSRVSADADAFFCSELCYQAALDAGLPMVAQKFAPRPGDFARMGVYKPRIRIF